ncbi:unnamed protein product [Closterium sp. NIES-64]|nr:unnamed protein product [Closterium sp. NIES-64]CAI5991212.1 unnamed protein product [Closterium sp. NIES-65]
MAEIPQFDEDMELTDEMLEAMEMPDEPAGSNFPRTRSPTDAPAPKKPCVAADSSIPPPMRRLPLPLSRHVVTLIFPEAGADAIRATLFSKIRAKLSPSLFDCGFIPDARPTNGETLRFPGRAYASIYFS